MQLDFGFKCAFGCLTPGEMRPALATQAERAEVDELAELLGKEECLARFDKAIAYVGDRVA